MVILIALLVTHISLLWCCYKKDYSILDLFWGPGIFFCSLYHYQDGYTEVGIFFMMVLGFWAFRLFTHLSLRKNIDPTQDFRYTIMQNNSKNFFSFYLKTFVLQALLMAVMAMPFCVLNKAPDNILTITCMLLAMVFALLESVADFQLLEFKRRKIPGRLNTGLWKHLKKPNYFFEIAFWWAIGLAAAPLNIASLVAPWLITYLILNLSGEQAFKNSQK